MHSKNRDELTPRNGHTLVVGIVARISGCANQKELSLEDQGDNGKEWIDERYSGPVEYITVATKGKGEALDRPELEEIDRLYRSGLLDLMMLDDLGRMVRGEAAVRLLGIGIDNGTRTVAINDGIDTTEDTWHQDALQSAAEHVAHNAQTSRRLKQKLMNRFVKFGGAPARPIYGYIVPPDAKTYTEWQKDPDAAVHIREGARFLQRTLNCSALADKFNAENVPTGPYTRKKVWAGTLVRNFYRNTLLKGVASRGKKVTVKNNESGRRVSEENPKGPKFWDCPHLAHLDALEFDELNELLDQKNAGSKRKLVDGIDSRSNVSKKRTRFPGQHSCCDYCGRQHVWGGNGLIINLMCSGAKDWKCWNSIGFNGALAVKKLMEAITSELYQLDGFDAQFKALVLDARQHADRGIPQRCDQLMKDEAALALVTQNVSEAVAQFGSRGPLGQMLTDLETRERKLAGERQGLERLKNQKLELPQSIAELRGMLEQQINTLAAGSFEFGLLLRELAPVFDVYLVRLCDGGHLLPRARVKLTLDGILPDAQHVPGLRQLLTREVTLDLFEPPQRERIRAEAVRLAGLGLTAKAIAAQITEKPTKTAVLNALALDRKMKTLGLSSPYVPVTEPPKDYPKLRRHKNPRYRFESVKGHQSPPI